ncbi:MAG: arginase [Deltaproteobacteria bacterium]|nr:arginase [Deltaproteobacteria bacterium]
MYYTYDCPLTEQSPPVVSLIGAALGLGSSLSGCAQGPDILRQHQPELLMSNAHVQAIWDELIRANRSRPENVVSTISRFCLALAERVKETIDNGERFTVIGGDHACAIGTWTGAAMAIADRGPLGLVWIDAHLDAHTPETSPSHCIHGMPVASLLGYGAPDLTDLLRPEAKLLPQHLCLVGVRSYEQDEIELLKKLGVRIILMEEIHRYGLEAALFEAVNIASSGTAGFGISIDVDAIHTDDAPAVGTPAADGIRATQLISAIAKLNTGQNLLGYEIAEFNPSLDIEEQTVNTICDLLVATVANYSSVNRYPMSPSP